MDHKDHLFAFNTNLQVAHLCIHINRVSHSRWPQFNEIEDTPDVVEGQGFSEFAELSVTPPYYDNLCDFN